MKNRPIGIGVALGASIIAAAALACADGSAARATMRDVHGKTVGEATLSDTPHGVLIRANFFDLPAGQHAFHIHTVGTCEPPFSSAGGHFNPSAKHHGVEAVDGMHAGDLPNLCVPESGKVAVEDFAVNVTLDGGMGNALLDGDGAALVVHTGADDYKTDPAGNAGEPLACGVIER